MWLLQFCVSNSPTTGQRVMCKSQFPFWVVRQLSSFPLRYNMLSRHVSGPSAEMLTWLQSSPIQITETWCRNTQRHALPTCSGLAVESRISVRVSPGWNRITSTMSLLVLERETQRQRCEKSKRSDKQQAADLDSAVWTHFSRSVFASISALASPGTSNLFVRVSDTSVLPISSLLGSSAGRGFSPECNRKQGIVNYWRVPDPWPAEWRQGLDSHRFRQTCCFHTNVPCQHILGQRKSKSQDMKTKMKTTEHWRKMFCGYVLRCSHAQQHIWSHLGIDSTLPTFKVL